MTRSQGDQGAQGNQGNQGIQGAQGDQGIQGAQGTTAASNFTFTLFNDPTPESNGEVYWSTSSTSTRVTLIPQVQLDQLELTKTQMEEQLLLVY